MTRAPDSPWSVHLSLAELGRGAAVRRLAPDEAARAAIAASLDMAGLPVFSAEVVVKPWEDGAEIEGRWTAVVTYSCGVSLEPFDAPLEGRFTVYAVPPDSPLAVPSEPLGEEDIDLDAEDPPDVLEGRDIDLGAYLVEHLALELEPFPRKPGAVFEAPPPEVPPSPFAVLSRLRKD